MEQHLMLTKCAVVATLTAFGSWLGWKGIMALVWIVMMILDYISGTAAACKHHDWSSALAREGLWHKGGMILVVVVAAIGDGIMYLICGNIPILNITWPGFILPMVLAWYIITEAGSILENAVKLGAHVPVWLTKLLRASLKAVDAAGDKIDMDDHNEAPPVDKLPEE